MEKERKFTLVKRKEEAGQTVNPAETKRIGDFSAEDLRGRLNGVKEEITRVEKDKMDKKFLLSRIKNLKKELSEILKITIYGKHSLGMRWTEINNPAIFNASGEKKDFGAENIEEINKKIEELIQIREQIFATSRVLSSLEDELLLKSYE